MIDELMAGENIEKDDIAAIVCGRGPGSFTGVRICMAAAKGIASGLEVPLFGVSTLDAVAWGVWESGYRGAMIVGGIAVIAYLYWYSKKIKADPTFSYTYEDREHFAS